MIMAATTFGDVGAVSGRQEQASLPRRIFDRFIEARQKHAQRCVNNYLQSLDDDMLRSLHYNDAEIAEIRRRPASVSVML